MASLRSAFVEETKSAEGISLLSESLTKLLIFDSTADKDAFLISLHLNLASISFSFGYEII